MTEILISIIVGLLIALYRISHVKCDDPYGEADRAFERGVKQLEQYYQKRDKKEQ